MKKTITISATLISILAMNINNPIFSMQKQNSKQTSKTTSGEHEISSAKQTKRIEDLTPEELNEVNEDGENMLFTCYSRGAIIDAKELKRRGAKGNINSKNNLGRSSLFVAYLRCDFEGAEALKHATFYEDEADAEGDIKIQSDLVGQTKVFLAIDMQDNLGQTPVFVLYSHGYIDRALKLIEKGATSNINTPDFEDRTPLFYAYMRGDFKTASELIKNGAQGDIDMHDKTSKTPIFAAYESGNIEAANALINAGAKDNINTPDNIGQTALFLAYAAGNKELIDLLIKNGAEKIDINAPNAIGQTPLFLACSRGDVQAAKKLKQWGATQINLNKTDKIGQTPLFVAYSQGNMEAVKKLKNAKLYFNAKNIINATGNINMKSNFDRTPLFQAFIDGNIEAAKILMANGAYGDVNTPNPEGETPLFYAIACGDMEIAKSLKKLGAKGDIYMKNKGGLTPLFLAILQGNIKAIQKIRDVCPNWNEYVEQMDNRYNKPIDIAIMYNLTEIVEYLLFTGAKHPMETSIDPKERRKLDNLSEYVIISGSTAYSDFISKSKNNQNKNPENNNLEQNLKQNTETEDIGQYLKDLPDLRKAEAMHDGIITPEISIVQKVTKETVNNFTENKNLETNKNKKKNKKKHKN